MRVLISGAGIAGPSLAWYLAKLGAQITIVEKARELLTHGQNVDIQGAAVTAVKRMGLLDEVRRFNTTEKGTQFIDPKGRPFAPFPITEGSTASLSSEFEILRADLAAIFYNATKDHPHVDYIFGTTIKTIISNDANPVKVELSPGEVQSSDLLVAADGQWSKVRKQCFPSSAVQVVDTGMTAVYFTVPRTPSDNDWWNIYIGLNSRIITTRPDPHGTIRAMFTYIPSTPSQQTAWSQARRSTRAEQSDLVRSTFLNAGWETNRLLDAMPSAPDFYFHVIQQIKMQTWSHNRVLCLGDAAYAPSPLTGAGTSLAILGAYMLAGEISLLKPGEPLTTALHNYESKFRPFVEQQQKIPPFVPGIAHPGSAWKRSLVNGLVWVLNKVFTSSWVKGRFADNEENDDGFKLPSYEAFEREISEKE